MTNRLYSSLDEKRGSGQSKLRISWLVAIPCVAPRPSTSSLELSDRCFCTPGWDERAVQLRCPPRLPLPVRSWFLKHFTEAKP